MSTGRFDHLAEMQTRATTEDAGGNVTGAWSTTATRWVSLDESGGRELYRAQQVDPTIDAVLTLRDALDGLDSHARVILDGRTFVISSVLGRSDRTNRRGQVLHCTEDA